MPMITVDGNIGSGKSTVLEFLHTRYGLAVDLEPVRKWKPYLIELYTAGKSAFEFQVRVWMDRCWIQMRPNQSNMVMERSPYFQSRVFVPTNYNENRISESELHTLNEMYAMSMKMWEPGFYIYLRSNPAKCMERIGRRQREGENLIEAAYIQQLHDLHERAYIDAVAAGKSILCMDVEDKTVEVIADEIYQALKAMKFA